MVRRLGVTLAGLIAYLATYRFPLPFLHPEAVSELSGDIASVTRVSWVALGIMPFVTGFLVVEIFSLLTASGRRLRHRGVEGRRRLNRWALGLSTLVALVQSYGFAIWLTRLSTPSGAILTSAPRWLLCISLTAGTFVAALLAEMISRYGLVNGYALLLVAPMLRRLISAVPDLAHGASSGEPEAAIMHLIWAGLFVAALVAFLLHRPETRLVTAEGRSLPYRLPPLPQGLWPLGATYSVVSLLTQPLFGGRPLVAGLGFWSLRASEAAGILALSLLGAWMFTARPRVEANLAGLGCVPAESYDRAWWRQLALAAVVLVVGETGLVALPRLLDVHATILLLSTLLPAMVVVLDVVDTARFAARSPLERVLTLDNVHLAEYLHAQLGEEGIECVVTSFRFRRLVYFFGPLYKMALLVPAADRERAEQLVRETPFEIV